jgi:hypothetical protein
MFPRFPRFDPILGSLFAIGEQWIRNWHLYQIVDDVYSVRTGTAIIGLTGTRSGKMKVRDNIMTTVALAIGTLAMAGMVGSGAYAQAAGAEARGVHALSSTFAQSLCQDPAPGTTLAAATPQVAP